MNTNTPLLRALSRALFRRTPPRQAPPQSFFCASPHFLSILPTSTIITSSRYLSTSPPTLQQLSTQPTPSSSTPPPFPPTKQPTSQEQQLQQQQLSILLPLLRLQPSHYITIHINSFPFLVTPGDTLTLPFLLPDVSVGDILRLTHASILGSRDYTIKGSPYLDENLFELRARVVEVTSEPMRIKIKKKQRTRRAKTVKSKHKYTVLRIGELVVKDAPALETAARGVEGSV
ncbi:ribosomal protein L21-like protein [Tirmania nivea]|nr:ribosomal protein L21-like protein [Tirmania nivea]